MFGEEKLNVHLLSQPGQIEAEQNDRKVKRSKIKKKG